MDQGYAALALTDECSLAGIVRAHQAATPAGLKLLVGSEMTTVGWPETGFPGPNREGYGNLSALITLARRRADKGSYSLHRHDLNAVSPSGAVPDCLVLWVPDEQAVEQGHWLAERFAGRLWIAVELHAGPDDCRPAGRTCRAGLRLPAAAGSKWRCAYARPGPPPGAGCADGLAPENHSFRGRLRALSQCRAPFAQPTAPLPALSTRVAGGNAALSPSNARFSLDELRYEYPEEDRAGRAHANLLAAPRNRARPGGALSGKAFPTMSGNASSMNWP